jgi:hypothetical protein
MAAFAASAKAVPLWAKLNRPPSSPAQRIHEFNRGMVSSMISSEISGGQA